MYRCCECGNLFEEGEEKKWKEDRGEFWGQPCYEEMKGCPLCEGDYEEVKPCKICGRYGYEPDDKYCENCKNDIKKRFQDFVDKEFTEEERKILNELYEGELI